jgi:hypothetical protein
MSIGSLGIVAGAAGAPLAQTKGSDVERNREAAANQQRQISGDAQAESAAGIGETDGQNHESHDRDADGRSPYTYGFETQPAAGDAPPTETAESHQAIDPTGNAGSHLDLTG